MTTKILYHASPYLFELFEMRRGGLHFGGLESAVQAVARHIDGCTDEFYLYTVKLDTSAVQDVFDCGGADDWEIEKTITNCKVMSYKNQYEPCKDKSYVVFCLSKIEIVDVISESILNYQHINYWDEQDAY